MGPYELVERIDGRLWRVRGPDKAPYSLVTGGHDVGTRLRHLRIPGMAALVDRGPGYLVYEDLPRIDVVTEVRARGPVKGERLVELLRVTARVMADLHRVGASHGGLGPRSVFLDGDRFVVGGPGAAGGADLVAWADLARFAATGEGAVPLADPLADLVTDCSCLPVDRRLSASEVCRRVELLTAPRRRADWAEIGRLVGGRRWPNTRRVPRPLVRAYDELHGTAPILELLYQFAAHDEREGTGWSRRRRGDRIEWAPPAAARGRPGERVTVAVELRNRGRWHWHNRFLRRTGPRYGPHILDMPELVPVPDVGPGHTVIVPVDVVLPRGAGVYGQRVTLVDEDGYCRCPRAEGSVIVRAQVG
ncbi:hypothetical protein [Actinophytocola oryzae]|nr:hypothetical protein [Actinophytocola oryzae]